MCDRPFSLRSRIWRTGLELAAALCLVVAPARAASPPTPGDGAALVIGNATYASLPALPGCALSAHAVAAALRRRGFAVFEQTDAALGQIDGALGQFSARIAAAPGAPAVVYLCGYADALNGRGFFLPVAASVARPTDLLTQGVLLASVVGALRPVRDAGVLAAFDLASRPGASPTEVPAIAPAAIPGPVGFIMERGAGAAAAPTPLAAALVAGLGSGQPRSGTLIAGIGAAIGASRVAARHVPVPSLPLVAAPPPVARAATPALPAAPAPVRLPDEATMRQPQRRDVQTALARLGYYDGRIDGVFGPDTRAAIRRYQFELHAAMTGRLTAEQATNLVTASPR